MTYYRLQGDSTTHCSTPIKGQKKQCISPIMAFIILLMLAITPLLAGNEWVKEYGFIILFIYSFLGTIFLSSCRNVMIFFMPISLMFLYVTWSMTFGALGHSAGVVLSKLQYEDFLNLQRLDEALCLIMLTISSFVPAAILQHERFVLTNADIKFPTRPLYVAIAVFLPFLFIPMDVSALGGSGSLNNVPRGLLSISAIMLISNIRGPSRYLLYILVLSLNAAVSSFNKREAIFLFFVIFILEAYKGRLRFDLSFVAKSIFFATLAFVLILSMSIVRGYGGFDEVANVFEALYYIKSYVSSQDFLKGFLNNIEVNYFFFHAVNAIEIVLSDTEHISFGSTLVKFLFLPFPRDLMPWKPDSAIGLYTTAYNPDYRLIGGSYPINIAAELVWNFWWFAPIFGLLLPVVFYRLHRALIVSYKRKDSLWMIFYLFIYMNVVTLARGGGFDQYVLELLVALAFILIVAIFVIPSKSPPLRER